MPDKSLYPAAAPSPTYGVREGDIESGLITKLRDRKYTERPDIRDRAAL